MKKFITACLTASAIIASFTTGSFAAVPVLRHAGEHGGYYNYGGSYNTGSYATHTHYMGCGHAGYEAHTHYIGCGHAGYEAIHTHYAGCGHPGYAISAGTSSTATGTNSAATGSTVTGNTVVHDHYYGCGHTGYGPHTHFIGCGHSGYGAHTHYPGCGHIDYIAPITTPTTPDAGTVTTTPTTANTAAATVLAPTITPDTVSGATARALSTRRVSVKWNKTSGAAGYEIYRSTDNVNFTKIGTVTNGKKTTYTDSKAKPNNTYYYKVTAYHKVRTAKTYGEFSNVCSAVTTKKR